MPPTASANVMPTVTNGPPRLEGWGRDAAANTSRAQASAVATVASTITSAADATTSHTAGSTAVGDDRYSTQSVGGSVDEEVETVRTAPTETTHQQLARVESYDEDSACPKRSVQ